MKTSLPYLKAAAYIALLLAFLSIHSRAHAQDSLLSQNFNNGVIASSLSAKGAYQSATLNWEGISFPSSGAAKAGYLLFYSTSAPSLLSSPNGKKPNNAVFNGTVVATTEASLPNLPVSSATASGLANGTTYTFMIVAYFWDGNDPSTYTYAAPATICVTIPPDAPDGISIQGVNSSSISGSFNQPLFPPDGYVVTYSPNMNAPALNDGEVYSSGQGISGDTVAQVSNSTSFNTINSGYQLSDSSNYYIHVYSYVISGCNNKPVYSNGYLSSDMITTAAAAHEDTTSSTKDFMDVIDVEPNPIETNGWLRITTHINDNNVNVAIFTIEGKIMAQRKIQVFSGTNRISLHTESFSRGVYILRAIFSNGKTKAIEFIKR
jgi:Secretion system C-terminal sorting domain